MTDRPQRSDDEVQEAMWTCIHAMLPTDITQVQANLLGLNDALTEWNSTDLRRLVMTQAGLMAHYFRIFEAKSYCDGDESWRPNAD